ncbi:MAG TPA: glycosyltransferase family 2 protein [Verrucomicrobiae bacterium]
MNPEKQTERRQSIAAVVVTYRPDAAILENVRRIAEQVSEIIVVDNATNGAAMQWIEALAKMPGVNLVRNSANLGIASALNTGVRRALQSGCSWIATFDQDTGIPENYFDRLLEVYQTCPDRQKAGMVVPGGWTESGMPDKSNAPAAPAWSFVVGAIASGSLIKAEIFEAAGYYDETLFIDYVDTDFCLRVQKGGFKILSVSSVFLEHELGQQQARRLLGFPISFRIHTAWRYYYIFRNRLLLYRRYWQGAPGWLLHDLRWMILELGRIFLLEDGRKQKIHAVMQGIKDGFANKAGRHPDFPPRAG